MDDFEEDPRYAVANREMWIGLGYWAAFTAAVTGTAWLVGGNVPAEETTFVLGFPAWFFWAVLVVASVGCLIPILLVRRVYTDMPLAADGHDDTAERAAAGGRAESGAERPASAEQIPAADAPARTEEQG